MNTTGNDQIPMTKQNFQKNSGFWKLNFFWSLCHWTLVFAACLFLICTPAHAESPWVKNEGYWGKTGGKLWFGFKNSAFSWMSWWTEARDARYQKEWEGFSAGIGKSVVDTAGGLVQLATFMIPLDFPDIGQGLHIPQKDNLGNDTTKKVGFAPHTGSAKVRWSAPPQKK